MKTKREGIKITESVYRELQEDYAGICLSCREVNYGIEPDADGYECDNCESNRVYGIEQLLIMGRIQLVDIEEEINIAC